MQHKPCTRGGRSAPAPLLLIHHNFSFSPRFPLYYASSPAEPNLWSTRPSWALESFASHCAPLGRCLFPFIGMLSCKKYQLILLKWLLSSILCSFWVLCSAPPPNDVESRTFFGLRLRCNPQFHVSSNQHDGRNISFDTNTIFLLHTNLVIASVYSIWNTYFQTFYTHWFFVNHGVRKCYAETSNL
jgi:hypothetical protein